MTQAEQAAENCRRRTESLNLKWKKLCDVYLPVVGSTSFWRLSIKLRSDDPYQGWKLHIAATVLNACRVLGRVAPFLCRREVLFKAPACLEDLAKLNAGIFYGYSQVGKFLTIYPRTNSEARFLARELHRLTRSIPAPSVPFDLEYRRGSCLYYRYGAFKAQEIKNEADEVELVIRAPDGRFVPDIRDSALQPSWAQDPFRKNSRQTTDQRARRTPLQTTFKAFRALAQRGKGGVYQALDLSVAPPRVCILKEGRRHGEVGWHGRDGLWRVKQEERNLKILAGAGVNVQTVYASFKAENNHYLALEFVEGETLEQHLTRRQRKLTISSALRRSIALARLLSAIHEAGWVWRDCKPHNIILTKGGELRPIDFEGACRIAEPDPFLWGTPSYTPPEWSLEFHGQSRLPEDLYALGVVLFLLLVGKLPDSRSDSARKIRKLRRKIPAGVRTVIEELLNADPARRPAARAVSAQLELELNKILSERSSPRRRSYRVANSPAVTKRSAPLTIPIASPV